MSSSSQRLFTGMSALLSVPCALPAGPQEWIRSLEEGYWPNPSVVLPRLEGLEDFDGDGLTEFLVGDPANMGGRVSVVSSVFLGPELVAFSDPPTGVWDAAALGDVNGDGVVDFGAASIAYPGGGIWIWSGQDFSLLHEDTSDTALSLTIASVGDVNQDGLQDIAYTRGGIHVIAGGTFEELYIARPDVPAFLLGWRIVGLGDVNGDRVPDFAASAPWDVIFGDFCVQAWIFVFSGADGRQLYRIQGTPPCDYLGSGMASPGDLNGDGINDLAASSAYECLRFFDGRNGALLGEACDEHDLSFFGRVVEAVGDINANGYGDVLVYGGNSRELPPPFNRSGQGEAWLIDGGTREFLYRITNPRSIATYRIAGYAIAFTACGDWNDDGQPDLAIAAPGTNPALPGLIDIYSSHPLGVRSLEDPCTRPADGPRIGASGIPVLGRNYPIHLSNVPPGTRAFLAVGYSPLGPDRAPPWQTKLGSGECGLLVRPDVVLPASAKPAGGKGGAATVHWKIANDPALVGTRLHAQWIVPQGRRASATTRALEITIQAGLPLPYAP